MGNINCQCQYDLFSESTQQAIFHRNQYPCRPYRLESVVSPRVKSIADHHKTTNITSQSKQKFSNMKYNALLLENSETHLSVPLHSKCKFTLGTLQTPGQFNIITSQESFFLQIIRRGEHIFMKDTGIGLGCFCISKFLVMQSNKLQQVMCRIGQELFLFQTKNSKEINYICYNYIGQLRGKILKDTNIINLVDECHLIVEHIENKVLIQHSQHKKIAIYLNNFTKIKDNEQLQLAGVLYRVKILQQFCQV